MLNGNMAAYAQDAVSHGASSTASGLQKVLEIQRDWILNKAAAFSESFDYTYYTSGNSGLLGYDSWCVPRVCAFPSPSALFRPLATCLLTTPSSGTCFPSVAALSR